MSRPKYRIAFACFTALLSVPCAAMAEVTRVPFGHTADGSAVEAITLTNAHGVSATVLTYGATLQAFVGPDRAGRPGDIVLGFSDAAAYERNASYFGGSIGRFANRIGGGRFDLDGRTYQLPLNDHGVSMLHGGTRGFDKQIWTVQAVTDGPASAVTLSLTSPNGDQGFPGRLEATATYALDDENQLTVTYRATTDAPTIVNLTNHALFNLAGEGAPQGAMGNVLTMPADAYTPVDAALIPTGEITPVAGTAFDFRQPRAIGDRIRDASDSQLVLGRGYDHNYVINGPVGTMRLAARLSDPASGRTLEILSAQPGLQFYAGNFIDGSLIGKSGAIYRQGDGIALEPQRFPDTPNKPAFGSARLDPGQVYENVMIFRLTVSKP